MTPQGSRLEIKPCLSPSQRKELDDLRAALHTALGWWADYERRASADRSPLAKQQGEEAADYRRCLALLNPREAG